MKKTRIQPAQRRRSIRAAFISAMSGTIYGTCLSAAPIQLFALKLGAGNFYLGLLNFILFSSGLFSLCGMNVMERRGKRFVLGVGWLFAFLLTCAFPALPIIASKDIQSFNILLWAMLIVSLLRTFCEGYAQAGWFPILQDNVPSRITGKFFASFRTHWQSTILVTTLFVAFLLGKDAEWWKYEVIFLIGLIASLVRFSTAFTLAEKPLIPQQSKKPSIFVRLKEMSKDKGLLDFLTYIISYNIPAAMTLPFQIKYLKMLGYSEGFILVANSMMSLGAIISLRFWGKLSDKFGNRAVFSMTHLGMMFTCILWILVGNNTFSYVFVIFLYLSYTIFNSGNGISQTRYMMHYVPAENQSSMVLMNAVIWISLATGPLLAGIYLMLTENLKITTGAISMNNFHTMFVISGLLFCFPHLLRKKLRLGKEAPTSEVFSLVTRPLRMMFGSFVRIPAYNTVKNIQDNSENSEKQA